MSGLKCGMVGLPNVGKSTLFNALTSNIAEAANYPFCTIDPNIGEVDVPDPRLAMLANLSQSAEVVHAKLKVVDIAGLVEGASKGHGKGNAFLSNIADTDAIIHVVRCFDDDNVIHVSGGVDPVRDIRVIQGELVLADLQLCENVIKKLHGQLRNNKKLQPNLDFFLQVQHTLEEGKAVRSMEISKEQLAWLSPYPFLTWKKVLYVANISESDLAVSTNPYVEQVQEYAAQEDNMVITVCAKLEEEIAQLDPQERPHFLEEVGLEESGLDRLIRASFSMLGLITFLTTGHMESRAWTICKGTVAHEAAGKIHTDIQRGFVRAEVIKYQDFVACGGRNKAKEKGLMKAEGRDYEVQDGDVVLFLHHSGS